MKYDAWEKLAHRYNNQWVQKYSLGPTRREVKKYVLPLLEKNNELKILDIGCGTGQLIKEISEHYSAVRYLGIDVAKNMIDIARRSNNGERIEFKNVSVDDFVCEEKFDIIICTHAFPYFPDKNAAMNKISSLCRKGGKVIIVSSSTNNLKDLIINMYVKIWTSKARYLSIAQMKSLFSSAGFVVKNVDVIRERAYMPTIALLYAEKE